MKSAKDILTDFFNGIFNGLSELESVYPSFLAETKNGSCGKCAMKRARRKYWQIVADILKEKGIS